MFIKSRPTAAPPAHSPGRTRPKKRPLVSLLLGSFVLSQLAPTVYCVRPAKASPAASSVAPVVRAIVDAEREARREADERAAGEAFAEAERLDGQWQESALRDAAGKYQTAGALWRAAGNKRHEAAALKKAGEILHLLGEPERARPAAERALKLYRETRDRAGEIETLNLVGQVYAYQGESKKALVYYRKALSLSRVSADVRGVAQSLNNMGEVYYNLSDTKAAIKHLNQALAVWPPTGDLRGRAQTLRYLGYTYTDLSDLPRALEYYGRSLALWREARDVRGEAQITNAIGLVHSLLGDKEQALEFYGKAADSFRAIGDREGTATALNGKGEVLSHLNELGQSLDCHEEAWRLCLALSDIDGQMVSLRHMGKVHQARGNAAATAGEVADAQGSYAQAVGYYEGVLKLNTSRKDRRIEALTLMDIGNVYSSLADHAKALSYFDSALRLNRATRNRRGEALTLNSIGHIHEMRGEPKKALTFYSAALPLTRVSKDRARESLTLYNLAHAEFGAGRLAEARAHVESSLQIIESLRTNVISHELRSSYFASVRQYYELYTSVLMRLHASRPGEGLDVRALEASERARARGLLDMLYEADADIRQGISPDLFERERALRQLLNAKAERQLAVLNTESEPELAASLSREIRALAAEYDEVEVQIRKQNPRYATLRQPRALALAEIQQLLDEDTLLLEYALGVERSYLWVVTRAGMTSHELPGRAEIEQAARNVYQLLTARQPVPGETVAARRQRVESADASYPSQAAALSRMLLSPVRERLASRRLLVVPDGALLYIPFGALPSPAANAPSEPAASPSAVIPEEGGADAPLIFKNEIVYLPSAAVLTALREETARRAPAPRLAAVLADPVFDREDPRLPTLAGQTRPAVASSAARSETAADPNAAPLPPDAPLSLPPLPASKDEAETVMSLAAAGSSLKAVGFDANKELASGSDLKKYRIIHIATHGILDNQQPELSGLVLSRFDRRGNPRDGFLRLHDIYNLDLPVELVVLSACNTGLGKAINGEGLVGLTRGFMYAGASRVMASMWKVDDEATAALMKTFYDKMLGDGLTPAAALRRAQLELWRRKRWQSPYFWAAFTLQGDYRHLPPVSAPRREIYPGLLASSVALIFALSLISLCVVKRARRSRIVRDAPRS